MDMLQHRLKEPCAFVGIIVEADLPSECGAVLIRAWLKNRKIMMEGRCTWKKTQKT